MILGTSRSVNQRDGSDPIAALSQEIEWQEAGGVCLVTGQRGTGKSTELLRLKDTLEKNGASVFYADMAEYLLLHERIEISDFLISVCGALSEEIEKKYRSTPGKQNYFERTFEFLKNTEVSLGDFDLSYGGASIKGSLKTDEHFKRRLQTAARGHISRLVDDAHGFVSETVDFVRQSENDDNRKVVLIVDSMERIRGNGDADDAMEVYNSVRDLFFGHADSLRLPSLYVVYSIPPYFSVLAGTGGLSASPRRLYGVHTIERGSGERDPAGLAVMREVIEKRHAGWRELIGEKSLDDLAFFSGGDLRDFFRLVRLCLSSVRDDGQLPLSDEIVDAATNAERNEMLLLPLERLDWLRRIATSHDACLPSSAELPTLAQFLDDRRVLVYQNGSDWYDVNPLLRDVVMKGSAPEEP